MTPNVITATINQTIRDACRIMNQNKIGSVIIVENAPRGKDKSLEYKSNPIGITTERDIVTHLGSKTPASISTPVVEIMSHPLVTIQSKSSLKDAIETMQLKNIRRLPVISGENGSEKEEEEKMVGIVTEKDIFRALVKAMPSSQAAAAEGMISEQMQFGYRFMYERFINEDPFSKDTRPGMG
jgi:CBS domain-containing protein